MGYFLAVKKVDPKFFPDMESIKQNADEFGIKVYQLAFNRDLHKMYCLCHSPSKNEIVEHLKRLDIVCDEIVEVEEQNSPSNFETISKFTQIGQTIASFSHDIRQSISVASLNSRLIKEKLSTKDVEQIKIYVDRVEDAIKKMNRNVNEILDFVRVAPLLKKETSIKKLLDESLSEFGNSSNISFRLPDYDVIVSCDDEKIQAVFSNIISNAISVKSKNIIISVSDDSSFVNIEFLDDGPGIPKQNLDKIFEPLFTTRPSGTGLGLCICKNIIEQHNGTITVKNDPTRFTITLPK